MFVFITPLAALWSFTALAFSFIFSTLALSLSGFPSFKKRNLWLLYLHFTFIYIYIYLHFLLADGRSHVLRWHRKDRQVDIFRRDSIPLPYYVHSRFVHNSTDNFHLLERSKTMYMLMLHIFCRIRSLNVYVHMYIENIGRYIFVKTSLCCGLVQLKFVKYLTKK
jgi:hypothetical protein